MESLFETEASHAVFSADRHYRYALIRKWSDGATCVFCMLNPSTADEVEDDPTIRRCIGFSRSWGYGKLIVVNIFAYRSTDPNELRRVPDPIGPENDFYIQQYSISAAHFICAWGCHGELNERGAAVKKLIRQFATPYCLNTTKDGHPVHPLYQKSSLQPKLFD